MNLATLGILSFFDVFLGNLQPLSAQARFSSESESWTKRSVTIYSLDLYKLEPKRIEKFHAMFGQSGHQDTFFENSRLWRQPLGDRQLALDGLRITL